MKWVVSHMYIEVTRRCDMVCAHCERGPIENVDLTKEDVDAFLDNFSVIQHLTFGGGEPTLNPDVVEYIVDKIIENGIIIGSFGMVTNGQRYSEKVADAFNRFDEYSKKKILKKYEDGLEFISGRVKIDFSIDDFHQAKEEVKKAYQEHCPWLLLRDHPLEEKDIIKTGYSDKGREFHYMLAVPVYRALTINNEPCICVHGSINISANGFVNTNPEGTYVDHDKCNFGHASNFSIFDFLVCDGIQARAANFDRINIAYLYFLNIRQILYEMGCDKSTIKEFSFFNENRPCYTPVQEKILRKVKF